MSSNLIICKGRPTLRSFILEKGVISRPRVIWSKFLTALIGRIGLAPKDGIFKIFMAFLDWRAFVHLTIIWMPGGAKIISALAR